MVFPKFEEKPGSVEATLEQLLCHSTWEPNSQFFPCLWSWRSPTNRGNLLNPGLVLECGAGMSHLTIPCLEKRRNVPVPGWQHRKLRPFPSWNVRSCWHHLNSCSIMKEFSSFSGNSDRGGIERRRMVPSKGTGAHGEQRPWIHSLRFPREFRMGVGWFHTQG